jgi:DtxR family Mn-dependent transcriptional regulator
MISSTEENYLKAIYKISEKDKNAAGTNAISERMKTTAASVTDMLKRLSDKQLINYEKYRGVTLTSEGAKVATNLIRNHRLWEVFLVDKLEFNWDEVHELAEQLEHIHSDKFINRLEKYLGNPKFDPHGDPIPNAEGKYTIRNQMPLSTLDAGEKVIVVGVKTHEREFLQYLDELGIALGTNIEIKEKKKYDLSMKVYVDNSKSVVLSDQVAKNLFVKTN